LLVVAASAADAVVGCGNLFKNNILSLLFFLE